MGIESARGEIRYRSHHKQHSLKIDLAAGGCADDGRIRVSTVFAGKRITVRVHAHDDVEMDAFSLHYERSIQPKDRFFLNGYQSWTDSREFSRSETIHPFPRLLRPLLEQFFRTNHYGDYHFVTASGQHLHGFTYFYLRQDSHGAVDFCGSLSEAEGYTIFRVLPDDRRIVVQKDCDGLVLSRGDDWKAFDLLVEIGDENVVIPNYLRLFHEVAGLVERSSPPWTGWTSWYYHYTNITEEIIHKNLDAFSRRTVPIDIFQIDDGWQGAVGDWLDVNAKFPSGMQALAKRIHDAGYRAGLWLAPFVAEKKSRLFREHPEWLLRDAEGNPVAAGNSNLWSGDFYGLDIYHQGLREYLRQVFDAVIDQWGMDLVKLDFLYGACLLPKAGKTRGQIMVDGMDLLRALVRDKFILGCGVPLGAAMGRVEVCRIGPDVGHEWANTLTRGLGMRETISTVTALENAIGRRHLSGHAFSNDPDVFFLRRLSFDDAPFDPFVAVQQLRWGKRIGLTDEEKYTLFLINNLFGRLVFTSDDIDEYDDVTMALYISSFPLHQKHDIRVSLVGAAPAFAEVGGCYEIRFGIGELRYVAIANLSNAPFTTVLRQRGFSRDARGNVEFWYRGQEITLEPHASICVLEEPRGDIALIGSDSHLFPGADIERWSREGDDAIVVSRHTRAKGSGHVYFRVPETIAGLHVNGKFHSANALVGQNHAVVVSTADI